METDETLSWNVIFLRFIPINLNKSNSVVSSLSIYELTIDLSHLMWQCRDLSVIVQLQAVENTNIK